MFNFSPADTLKLVITALNSHICATFRPVQTGEAPNCAKSSVPVTDVIVTGCCFSRQCTCTQRKGGRGNKTV